MSTGDQPNSVPNVERYRSYLKLQAELQLNPRLRVKADASDVVQQAMLEAYRDIHDFRGESEAELQAWLKKILSNNLARVGRHYATKKRALDRERPLESQLEQSSVRLHRQLTVEQSSPSTKLMANERSEELASALLRLLDDERTAVVLKHIHNWPVSEIAQYTGRTSEAVSGLLRRGLAKLRKHLRKEE